MIKNNHKKAVVLLSGGLDSATVMAIVKSLGYEIYALTFIYGQKHQIELKAAQNIADLIGVKQHHFINLDLKLFPGSSLTSDLQVPKNKQSSNVPNTYVPARNTIFLSYALGYAESNQIFDIFIGANKVDYSGYPDCRPQYLQAFETMANLATKAGIGGEKFTINSPLLNLTKAEIIKQGQALGLDYSLTHSCYDPVDGLACGQCESCFFRKRGFSQAGTADPTKYVVS